jgi:CBS domain-containing protein
MRAQDIMTKDPSCVTPTATVREAVRIMKDENVGIVPVVESNGDRKLIGVVTDRDVAIRCVGEGRGADCHVRDVMSADRLATASPDDDLDRVMDAMSREQVRRIPVVDDRGSLLGIVSQADVVRKTRDEGKAEDVVEKISQPSGKHAQ